MFELLIDLVRVVHLISFAIGVGATIFLGGLVLSRARVLIEERDLALHSTSYRVVLGALAMLWLTCVAQFGLRFGFDLTLAGAATQTQLWMLAALTANTLVAAWVVTPILRGNLKCSLSDFTDFELCVVGGATGLTAAAWLSLLVLGEVAQLAAVPGEMLSIIFGAVLIAGALGGAAFAVQVGQMTPGAPIINFEGMFEAMRRPKRRVKRRRVDLTPPPPAAALAEHGWGEPQPSDR
ncbi:MAG: hypothetical protein AAF401_12640 [Pseudomonadota bacterium]